VSPAVHTVTQPLEALCCARLALYSLCCSCPSRWWPRRVPTQRPRSRSRATWATLTSAI